MGKKELKLADKEEIQRRDGTGYEYNPQSKEPIVCQLCYLQDYIGNMDLDSKFHEGFTIGNGKQLYWEITWHNSGHATVYPLNGKSGRWVDGGSIIKIHFKKD